MILDIGESFARTRAGVNGHMDLERNQYLDLVPL